MATEQPKQAVSKKDTKTPFGAQVFSMPERYRHGAEASMKEPESAKKPQPQTAVAPPLPPKAPPKPPVVQQNVKKRRGGTKILLFVGLLVILVLGVGGYFLVQSVQPEEVVIELEPEEEPEQPEEVPEVDPFATEVVRGTDSDSDGLTDAEEEYVYNTDPRLPDTDSDGFLDGNEVFHRYNPNGEATGGNTLLESGVAVSYSGSAYTVLYSFLYPTVWTVEEEGDELVIDSNRGEGIRIGYARKTAGLSLEDWVEINIKIEDPVDDVTKNGLEMILSENTLFAYIDLGDAVLTLEYDTGTKARVDYLQTFKMLLNSIEITGAQEVAATTEETTETEAIEAEPIDAGEEAL